ncbi:MAG: recombinase RecA [Acidobacteriaceae bacterium]|nr:recombinase RecA [Acidobacteriaceae bacterium]
MHASAQIRAEVEAALARKFPSALTPPTRVIRPVVPSGISVLDEVLAGGFPVGAMTELVGDECSGRTSVAVSFLSTVTSSGKVCAWIDASNTFNPAAAASSGVDLNRVLWVRCGVQELPATQESPRFVLPTECFTPRPILKGLHGGGHGTHPRTEARGLSSAVDRFLNEEYLAPRCAEQISKPRPTPVHFEPSRVSERSTVKKSRRAPAFESIEQALRCADLVIQAGGFGAIILDFGAFKPEFVSRIELSTWHRYRVAAEQNRSSILLLTQYPCAKSSSELQLKLLPMQDTQEERTVFAGLNAHVEIVRQRFTEAPTNLIPMRKPPQRAKVAGWHQRTSWVGPR